ncbi:MAG: adaptor protein MecA [Oscillospiraceae bacterium]
MDIIFINQNKVKVVLYKKDIEALGITTSLLECDNDIIKNTLDYVLGKITRETGMETKNSKIFVEAYRNSNETISIYFTKLGEKASVGEKKRYRVKQGLFSPFVAEFTEINQMIKCCVAIYKNYCHRIRKSTLYKLDSKYYVILFPIDINDKNIPRMFDEFLCKSYRGEILSSHITEHGMPIIKNDAVDIINTYFSR